MDKSDSYPEFDIEILDEDDLQEFPVYRLDLEEAKEAAEYHAIFRDAQFVTRVCEHLEWRLIDEEEESRQKGRKRAADIETHVDRSLWTAALITYIRCYGGGVRVQVRSEDVVAWAPDNEAQPPATQEHFAELHEYFRGIRDKHIAHSVNPMEDTAMCASLYGNDDVTLDVEGFALVHVTSSTLHHSYVQQLGVLAEMLSGLAKHRSEDASKRAAERAKSMSQAELRNLRPYKFKPQEDSESVWSARPGGTKTNKRRNSRNS